MLKILFIATIVGALVVIAIALIIETIKKDAGDSN